MDEHYLHYLKYRPETRSHFDKAPNFKLFNFDETYFIKLFDKYLAFKPLFDHKKWLDDQDYFTIFKTDTGKQGVGNYVKIEESVWGNILLELQVDIGNSQGALDDYITYEDVSLTTKLFLIENTQKEVQRLIDIPFPEQVLALKEKLYKSVGLPPTEKEKDKLMLEDYFMQVFDLYEWLRNKLEYISELFLIEMKALLFELYFEPNKSYFLLQKDAVKTNLENQKLSTKEFMAYIDIMQEIEPENHPKIEIGSKPFFNKYKDQLAAESNCTSYHSLRTFKAKTGNNYRKNYLHIYRSNDWNTLTKETLEKLTKSIKNVRRKFKPITPNEVIGNFNKRIIRNLNKRIKEIENHIAEKENLLYKT